ncbi:hypothetical protein BD770DRAFT_450300 [Pilaira anomala]|nr:hypothetical protein BD770DRAFT_450300 [Pilaira anomala]
MTQHYCPCDSCKEKNGGQPKLKIKEIEKSLKERYARVNSIESSNEIQNNDIQEQQSSPMNLDNDSQLSADMDVEYDEDADTTDSGSEYEQQMEPGEDLDYLDSEITYEEEEQAVNMNEDKRTINAEPLLNNDQVRREVYALFLSAYRTKFSSTDKEIHSLLHFLRIALADTVTDPNTCNLPKSFKTIAKEIKQVEDDFIEYMVCKKCHTLYQVYDNVRFTTYFA